jgi:hypothetical protein
VSEYEKLKLIERGIEVVRAGFLSGGWSQRFSWYAISSKERHNYGICWAAGYAKALEELKPEPTAAKGEGLMNNETKVQRDALAEKATGIKFGGYLEHNKLLFKQGFDAGHALAIKQAEVLVEALKKYSHEQAHGFTAREALTAWFEKVGKDE